MPGQFLEAPCFQLEMKDWADLSAYIRERKRDGALNCGIMKMKLPPEVVESLSGTLTELGDVSSPSSFYKCISEKVLHHHVEQRVEVVDKFEGVYTVEHSPVSMFKNVGEFYEFAKRERDFGSYEGIVRPPDGVFDVPVVKGIVKRFWNICNGESLSQKPFLYAPDIELTPTKRLGSFEGMDTLTVSDQCDKIADVIGNFEIRSYFSCNVTKI